MYLQVPEGRAGGSLLPAHGAAAQYTGEQVGLVNLADSCGLEETHNDTVSPKHCTVYIQWKLFFEMFLYCESFNLIKQLNKNIYQRYIVLTT